MKIKGTFIVGNKGQLTDLETAQGKKTESHCPQTEKPLTKDTFPFYGEGHYLFIVFFKK